MTGAILYEFLYGVTPFGYAPEETFDHHVIEDEVPWPEEGYSLPPDVLSLMRQLLDKNPVTRLGTRGASEVKGHLFFQAVDWQTLLDQTPPYVPPAKVEEPSQSGAPHPLKASAEDDGWGEAPAKVADFSYVAFRFREEYGSAQPLSSHTPHLGYCQVEEQKMDFDGGFDDDIYGGFDDRFNDRFEDRYNEDYDEDLHEDYDDGFHEDLVEVHSSSPDQASVVSVDHSVVEFQTSHLLPASTWGNPESLADLDEDDGWTPQNSPMIFNDMLQESCNVPGLTFYDSDKGIFVFVMEEDSGESSSRSHWPRTAAARCRKAWRASKAFWRRVFKRRTPLQSERTHRKKAEEMVCGTGPPGYKLSPLVST